MSVIRSNFMGEVQKQILLFKKHYGCTLEQLRGDSLLLINKFPGTPGIHFNGHRRMKACADLGTTYWF